MTKHTAGHSMTQHTTTTKEHGGSEENHTIPKGTFMAPLSLLGQRAWQCRTMTGCEANHFQMVSSVWRQHCGDAAPARFR